MRVLQGAAFAAALNTRSWDRCLDCGIAIARCAGGHKALHFAVVQASKSPISNGSKARN